VQGEIQIPACVGGVGASFETMAPKPSMSGSFEDGPEFGISLATSVAGIAMPRAIFNSSSPAATSVEDLKALVKSPATGAFTTHTTCPYFIHDDAKHQWREWKTAMTGSSNTIHCFGYSCHSFKYYVSAIREVQTQAAGGGGPNKPAIMSVTGRADQVAQMLEKLGSEFASSPHKVLVEINLLSSCPNNNNNSAGKKPPLAYDFEAMKSFFTSVFSKGSHGLKVGVKTSPYFYDAQFAAAAQVINSFVPHISFVTCINTLGCGLVIDPDAEAPILAATGAVGGLGGPVVHATALANVHQLRRLLVPEIDIIGAGGADSGLAVFRFLLCGASAVSVTSALLTEGMTVFERIEAELKDILAKKGYSSIDQFRGKLKG
jgi:dihydroorotate dehydrogenase (fumarate)